jgi:hypothetical protein
LCLMAVVGRFALAFSEVRPSFPPTVADVGCVGI